MLNSIVPFQNQDNYVKQSLDDLQQARFWENEHMYRWEGFWLVSEFVYPTMTLRSTFRAREDDIFLASTMKAGTTWLKSLSLCIMHQRTSHSDDNCNDDILTKENPHILVPTIEAVKATQDASAPRLLHTHLPYAVLPDSIKNSACKFVYITRNPKDTLISMWHFWNSIYMKDKDPFPLEKAVDCFCSGEHPYGPFFDHVVGYWQESQKRPEKILFLKYEEMKSDPKGQVSKIAEFLGRPFRDEGEVDEVLWRCSLERLKNLEVNQRANSLFSIVPNNSFFRKGEVGDWQNYLTPEMEERINQISRSKLESIGLFLN